MAGNNRINLSAEQIVIFNGITTILMELINDFTSSSESEDEQENVLFYTIEKKKPLKKIRRLENYVENIVPAYSDQQFKSHFR